MKTMNDSSKDTDVDVRVRSISEEVGRRNTVLILITTNIIEYHDARREGLGEALNPNRYVPGAFKSH